MTPSELLHLRKGDLVLVPPEVTGYPLPVKGQVSKVDSFMSDIYVSVDYLEPTPDCAAFLDLHEEKQLLSLEIVNRHYI